MLLQDLYQLYLRNPSVQTDTRKLRKGDFFFALKGPNFNANTFALQALNMGAAYAVVDEAIDSDDERLILVEDVLTTLQALAKYHRQQCKIPFIAITGSNGKTTSKELMYAVLSSHYKTYTTEGNLNNHIGVPLTILRVKPDAAMAVIEMGANHLHEIEAYCAYTLPTHGVITNCGKAHLEGFGSLDGVKKGKGELYDYLRSHAGTAFVYADDAYLQTMSAQIKQIVKYGTTEGLVQGQIISNDPYLQVSILEGLPTIHSIQTQLVGDYNLPNILCAAAVGIYFSVPAEKIKAAIENYTPSNSRSQLLVRDSNTFILDAYNANPSSMQVAIENFAKNKAPKKIVLLGGMMELGADSIDEHKKLITLLKQYPWQAVVLVGGDFANIAHGFTFFANVTDAKQWFAQQAYTHTHFLIKGSRSMQMEKMLE